MYPSGQWGLSYQGFDAYIRLLLLQDRQYTSPPPQVIEPEKTYIATIRTEQGDIVAELYASSAPANVNSFVFLAQEGWYDGVTFHRVIPGFVVQAGDPTGTGGGGPGYQCDDEIDPNLSYTDVGVIGIANAGSNTGSSQFFITLAPQEGLDGRYTIIGQVIDGFDVLQSISPRDPGDPNAPPGDIIVTIVIEER
ncbi:MAG: peptidylprolyl isomerase [Anaerolineae bacterium]|nr:peptidylprolyl isomerase [Anaerolineae bacterium]